MGVCLKGECQYPPKNDKMGGRMKLNVEIEMISLRTVFG